jgi:ribokinase
MTSGFPGRIAVVGQLARDLVLLTDAVPEAGGSGVVRERRELLGGKGANHALGLHQLGAEVSLVAVAGDDAAGAWALSQAGRDGIDVSGVRRRGSTALLVDVVEQGGPRRLLEHVPDEALLTADDVRAAAELIRGADTVCLQLQQPAEALLAAAELARAGGARVLLDGAIDEPARGELLTAAQVVRADAKEASLLSDIEITGRAGAERAAAALLDRGPALAAVGVPGEGDLVAWAGGSVFLPFGDAEVVDVTGAGDAFLAGLVTGVRLGWQPERAGRLAAAAAASTVQRLGGRPDLTQLRPDGAR